MTLSEKQKHRADLLARAQALLTSPTRTKIDILMAENLMGHAEDLQIEISREENSRTRTNYGAAESDARRAFSDFIRFGRRSDLLQPLGASEQRDLLAGSGGGAYLVPQEFYPVLTEAQKAWGGLVNIVAKRETDTGAPMKFAFSNDTGNLLHESGEPASVSETDPPLSSALSNTDMFDTGVIKVSVQELQDSAFDLDTFVRDAFGKRYFRGLTEKITNGSISGNVESIIGGYDSTSYVSAAADGAIDYDDLTALYAALDPAYIPNAAWSMHAQTRGKLLGVKDSLGRPLYIPSPTSGAFDTLLGQPVILNQSAPTSLTTGTKGVILFGDHSQGYLLRTVKPGLAIVRLNELYMGNLEIGFIGYVRAGGIVTDAGTHPIVSLNMP